MEGESGDLDIRLLGPIEVLSGGEPVDLPDGRARSLLVVLALQVGRVVTTERLIDELWGEQPPATARTVVQGFVSRLRRVLQPDRAKGSTGSIVETVGAGYRLARAPETVDVNRFRQLLDDARSLTGEKRVSTLESALGIWRGPALADVEYEPFAQRAITALDELRISANEDLVDAKLHLGRHAELIPQLEELVVANPYRERLRCQLMLAMYRAGRQADALEAYERARLTLLEELGLDPSPALQELEEQILKQDPALDETAVPTAATTGEREEAPGWLSRERKAVTAVFVDLSPVDVDPDPEAGRLTRSNSLENVANVIRTHGGRIEPSVGDVVVGLFGLPVAHEDDPLRAVRAALAARDEVLNRTDALAGFRAGLETGEILTDGEHRSGVETSGPAVTVAARLQQAARQTDVLIGPATMRLVHGSAVVAPVGDSQLVAWRLLEVNPDATFLPRHLHAPMVGRTRELTHLRTAFSSAVRRGEASRLTVIGEAGIGKSRLSRAFTQSISGRAGIAETACPAVRASDTFSPLNDILVQAAGPGGWPDLAALLGQETGLRDQVAGAIGVDPLASQSAELFVAVRRAFELLTTEQALAVVLDDVHWAEPTLLDLIEYLTENLEASVLFLCLARPELLEEHPIWATESERSELLHLEPLDTEDLDEVIVEQADVDVPPDTRRKITEAAQGNPLFAEQLLSAIQNDETDTVPASLRGLLAMRIDQLGPGERDLLRSAAVAGDDLTVKALETLVPDRARPYLRRHLETLERRRFMRRSDTGALRFSHGLIREAAYQTLTFHDRARLHLRFADWLEARDTYQPSQSDVVVGFHLEQAVMNRRKSGLDDPQDGLAARAGERLADAGAHAYKRWDMPAAERLLARALTLLPSDHPRLSGTTQQLAEVSLPLGHHVKAQELLHEIASRPDVDPAVRWSARVERARSLCQTGPDPVTHEEISGLAREAFDFFDNVEDDAGRAQAIFLLGQLDHFAGRMDDAAAAGRRSMFYADRANAQREKLSSRYLAVAGLIDGPTPVEECIHEAEPLALVDGAEHPIVMFEIARLHAMAERFDEARSLTERARQLLVERFRIRRLLMFEELSRSAVATLATDFAVAERANRAALRQARDGGERWMIAEIAARLSLIYATQDRLQKARNLASESSRAAPTESVVAQALSRMAMARTLPRAEADEAITMAEAAVHSVPDEIPNLRADLLVELAGLARASGRTTVARDHTAHALNLYERKGNLAAAHNLR